MKSRSELEAVKNFVESVYSNYHNLLIVNTEKPFDPLHSELGYFVQRLVFLELTLEL